MAEVKLKVEEPNLHETTSLFKTRVQHPAAEDSSPFKYAQKS
jgi:hypothetical protein